MVRVAVTGDDIRQILSERRVFMSIPADLTDDQELTLDSMGVIWIVHVLEETFGIVIEPDDADLEQFTSINRIRAYVNENGRALAPEGAP